MSTVASLITQVKREHKITTASLDDFILDLVNEGLRSYARKHRYQDLLVLDHEIAASTGSGVFNLPNDFCNIANDTIFFVRSTNEYWKLFKQVRGTIGRQGVPYRFRIGGGTITLSPYSDVLSTDLIRFNYYQYPATITTASDFPVPALFDAVKQFVLVRLSLFDDSKLYKVRKGEEVEKFIDSVSND